MFANQFDQAYYSITATRIKFVGNGKGNQEDGWIRH